MSGLPRLYSDLSEWWPLLSAVADYAEEAGIYAGVLGSSGGSRVLELGSGGGNNASHLKSRFEMTLVDLSPGMLAVSRSLNPECDHIEGDMRTVRLGRTFDAVFVHDAIGYITNRSDLADVASTARAHCREGGLALFVPDVIAETFHPYTSHGGHDGDTRSLRYLEWVWDPDSEDETYVSDMAYLLRERERVEIIHDRHTLGLFSKDVWTSALEAAGFEPEFDRAALADGEPLHLFTGRAPAAG